VFLDRDGVIIEHRGDHVKNWDEFEFLPGAVASLRRLALTPLAIAVVSNQPAVNTGLLPRREASRINERILAEIKRAGGRVDGIYVCPHRPDEACACRKPEPGLLYQAASELAIDLSSSYFVGDTLSDVKAALAAGCSPILVLTDRGCKELEKGCCFYPKGFFVAPDIAGSVDSILEWSHTH
jgi:D-glycero-D-manno-heptose 1,7-bisphosphate phosphatase